MYFCKVVGDGIVWKRHLDNIFKRKDLVVDESDIANDDSIDFEGEDKGSGQKGADGSDPCSRTITDPCSSTITDENIEGQQSQPSGGHYELRSRFTLKPPDRSVL
ncbi:hypothetical protein JTB14_016909 [Gonioctena quinquepunctata]|nr:hypothetical protein JTB14_016909 [Gonioctena quinquepunctata]